MLQNKKKPPSSYSAASLQNKFSVINFSYQIGIQVSALIAISKSEKREILDILENFELKNFNGIEILRLKATCAVLDDLLKSGWRIELDKVFTYQIDENGLRKRKISAKLFSPEIKLKNESPEEAKSRARISLLQGVKESFKETSVEQFISSIENQNEKNKSSIFDLIEDPQKLHKKLLKKDQDLREVIDPYIEFVEENKRDKHTNLKLADIWRYFRMTWSLEYKSNPGRSLRIIIRNKATYPHTVMGIAQLSSPVISLGPRDERLALSYGSFLDFAKEENLSLEQISDLMMDCFTQAKSMISVKGLRGKGNELKEITRESLKRRESYLKEGRSSDALDSLFLAKRSKKLGEVQQNLQLLKFLINQTKKEKLKLSDVEKNKNFQSLVNKFLNQKKIDVISSDIMDLSVCGAVFPYNNLLVGKLVAILSSSHEVKKFVDQKYANSESIIASKMAGKKVKRSSNLLGLTTTSLYGVSASQYNRLKLKTDQGILKREVNWEELSNTKGYGTFHFSKKTRDIIERFYNNEFEVQKVTYEFGEGTSPTLRKLRDGLSNIGFSQQVLKHEFYRKTYFCDLTGDIRKKIFGFKQRNVKLDSQKSLSSAWIKRYLEPRIKNEKVMKDLSSLKKDKYSLSKIRNKLLKSN